MLGFLKNMLGGGGDGSEREMQEVHFIRADTSTSRDAAITLSVSKARKIIDEQGERVFRVPRA